MNKFINSRIFIPVFIGTLIALTVLMIGMLIPFSAMPYFFGWELPPMGTSSGEVRA